MPTAPLPHRVRRPARPARALLPALIAVLPVLAAPAPPPGPNVHLVRETPTGVFWRGGGPRRATLEALAQAARKSGRSVTLVDLRTPPNQDDRSGKDGRLSPADEAAAAKKLGMRYLAVSALDRDLPTKLADALAGGDVYLHCMYGVNRTGFATARYARAAGVSVSEKGLGKRDWKQGEAFQARLDRKTR